MKVGYVVLYVQDEEASLDFWTKKIGLEVKDSKEAAGFTIRQVGFADQDFSFELVPLKFMETFEHGMSLGTPSIAFRTPDLEKMRVDLLSRGVTATEISSHFGVDSFAFSDDAGSWFAVIKE
ncbi:MAG: VOC family protein [Leptospirales bacterium]|nr:VOC family protein [Leptospirales bacterium]